MGRTPPVESALEGVPQASDEAGVDVVELAVGLLLVTALAYLWNLSANGWANSFYSAAAQAGSQSWTAMFYGSSDAANAITVDKPPASLWVMALSVRLLEAPPSLSKASRRKPDQMAVVVEDLIKLLDGVGNGYRHGRHPDAKHAAKIAQVLRAVADELEL